MVWDQADFILKETALQLRRERLIAIATISTVAVLLLVLGAIVLFQLDLRLWTNRMAQELDVYAYFDRSLPSADARKTARQIAAWPEVKSSQFIPREEGLKSLQRYLPSGASLRRLGNPLPDGVRLRLHDPKLVPDVGKRLASLPGVKNVVPDPSSAVREDSFVQKLVRTKRAIAWTGVLIGVLVTIAGVFIVHNTIRLALHARRREIYIMQLVGATRGVIAAPFLLEGLTHGLLGAAIAACFLLPTHMYLRSLFSLLLPDSAMLTFGLYLLLTGALLGLTGSAVSLRRFLRRRPEWHT